MTEPTKSTDVSSPIECVVSGILRFFTGVHNHKVTYIATGFMSNKYEILTAEFTSTRKERREFKGVPDIGFYKNYYKLERHCKKINGLLRYDSYTH